MHKLYHLFFEAKAPDTHEYIHFHQKGVEKSRYLYKIQLIDVRGDRDLMFIQYDGIYDTGSRVLK